MISVSGVRGRILKNEFTTELISLFSSAFASFVKSGTVVVGKDTRLSGNFIESILTGQLLSRGISVHRVGIAPTPTIKSIAALTKANAGVIISSSHNPMEWNAFKFLGKGGFFFSAEEMKQLMDILENSKFQEPKNYEKAKSTFDANAYKMHLNDVKKILDVELIRKRKLKVVLDAVGGAGSLVVKEFLESLGCKVIPLFCEPSGNFPRPPEPTPSSLSKVSKLTIKEKADIGFALDPDADRLVCISPTRGSVSEEYTVPMFLLSVLSKEKTKSQLKTNSNPNIVVNLSSSFLNEAVALQFGKKVIRSKVGEANVVETMKKMKAMFGGEGNGGVIDSRVSSFGRDSLVGIGTILELLARTEKSFDSLLDDLGQVHMLKATTQRGNLDLQDVYDALKNTFPDHSQNTLDGLRLENSESWIHARPSNTEPIVRLIVESRNANHSKEILKKAQSALRK